MKHKCNSTAAKRYINVVRFVNENTCNHVDGSPDGDLSSTTASLNFILVLLSIIKIHHFERNEVDERTKDAARESRKIRILCIWKQKLSSSI